jgi:hypothetical protein
MSDYSNLPPAMDPFSLRRFRDNTLLCASRPRAAKPLRETIRSAGSRNPGHM